jgi:hypothetical protein
MHGDGDGDATINQMLYCAKEEDQQQSWADFVQTSRNATYMLISTFSIGRGKMMKI